MCNSQYSGTSPCGHLSKAVTYDIAVIVDSPVLFSYALCTYGHSLIRLTVTSTWHSHIHVLTFITAGTKRNKLLIKIGEFLACQCTFDIRKTCTDL